MNGYECGDCDCSPCVCAEIEKARHIKEGKIALESIWSAFASLPKKTIWSNPNETN